MTTSSFLSSRITALTTNVIQELSNPNKHSIEEYLEILKNPWAAAAVDIKAQRAANSLGEYQHKNKEVEKFIKDNIENMVGSLPDIVATLTGAMPFGHMAAEIGFRRKKKFRKVEWRLDGFNVLDPSRLQYAGHYGRLTHVKYNDTNREIWIPYDKVIHITNGLATNFNRRTVYGNPECEVAYPYVKLYSLIMQEMAISAKTLATGILLGLADADNTILVTDPNTGEPIRDRNGQPLKRDAVFHLAEQLKLLENHSHIVTDKKNAVSALQIPAGEQFWTISEQMLKRCILAAFRVPSMVLDEGSGAMGMATLSVKHMTILDATVEAVVKQIRDNLIEKVCRPLIIWNFGTQDDYGSFEITATSDPQTDSLITQNLMSAMSMGLINQTDMTAQNALRERLKLPPITPEMQQQQAMQQQMLASLQQPAVDPNQQQVPEEYQQDYLGG
ncbi:hypothetical protein [Scytonema sp. NUACC26]|uniref:phage portal protein family protein n=1 Tax=Scytonema sp. NUACC26 TaxID=3140176 RepID=UPI0034DBFC91